MMKQVCLSDTTLFRLSQGKRVTEKELYNLQGNIPTYSTNVFEPKFFLKKSNIDDFTHDSILYGIDGYFELSPKLSGEVFGTTDHCGRIEILDSFILPNYLIHQLKIKGTEQGFERTLRANLGNMRKIIVEIPIKIDESFDTEKQLELVKKYLFLKKMNKHLQDEIKELDNIILELNYNSGSKTVKISDIYDFAKTNSHMTKKLCNVNPGQIPVYGCSYLENEMLGRIAKNIPGVKYYKDSLTWNRNGSVGRFFIRDGLFSTNEDHRVLILKKGHNGKVDPMFMKYTLEKEVRKLGYTFLQKLGQSNLETIEISMPTTKSKEFDLKKQKEIAETYRKLYDVKEGITKELAELAEIAVNLSH